MLDGHEGGAAPLTAGGEALQDAQQDQQDRRGHADGLVGRQDADEGGRQTHTDQGDHEDGLASVPVAEVAGDDRTQGAEQEADADRGPGEDLGEVVAADGVEEQWCEDEGRGLGVDEEVVPLDGGADEGSGKDPLLFAGTFTGRLGGRIVDGCSHRGSMGLVMNERQ